uniref:NADH-ubiquinone oxidoreductase chain 6 n=1 Tax=Cryptopygus antarcticus TaxID=187623 RepID=B2BSC2_CRYAT|nr:NADH dehydrogenase subunit 6 [Cryptopygus antarcticus]ABS57575.1 NADH dehydrogenase subunit 6 [Cryptopygus antarcticus]
MLDIKLMFISSVFSSMMIMSSSHPVAIMAYILMQTIIVCLMAWMFLKTSWFSFILFLVFLGGLMVLFIYITSLASNEMIKLNLNNMLLTLFTTVGVVMIMMSYLNHQMELKMDLLNQTKTFFNMYSFESLTMTGLAMIYLLLTLIVVVKISNKFNAPIKNLIFE